MGLRERKKQALRETLYNQSVELFRRDGFDQVPVTMICQAAGIAKGTFFNHFPTKDHVLVEWYTRINTNDDDALPPSGSVDERLMTVIRRVFDQALADADLWRSKQERVALNADLRAVERASDARARTLFARILSAGVASGELKQDTDTAAVADLLVVVLTGTVHDWTLSEGTCDFMALASDRIDTLLKTLAS